MSAVLHVVWDRLGRGARTSGQVDNLPIDFDTVVGPEHLYAVAAAIHTFAETRIGSKNFEVLAHPEGYFTVQGGAYGSGLWSLVSA